MEPLREITAVAAPLLRDNVDTDAIIPSREMKTVSKTGLADGLFAGWRYTAIGGREPDPSFVLNQADFSGARILLGGANFGCGSSREHAVWALHEYGIRAVIAPSFAPIFAANCIRNGLSPVRLPADAVAALAAHVAVDPRSRPITVDMLRCEVRAAAVDGAAALRFPFTFDAESRDMLLEGLDAIDLTLKHRADIEAFLIRDRSARPWIHLGRHNPDRST
ncbi:MAG: 3-isopropylmalate dehydratase small subunit [Gammaproteobacteria bacterium]|nr:3-isopropylmalate dehydratase small subunit [Gammaproteobacteria bacterium]